MCSTARRGFYGGNAIVGGGLPLAVGTALGDKMLGRDAVTACFFGDGAVDEGSFHESMNLAALWKLPVLFVCENNLYAMGMALERAEAEPHIATKAAGYHIVSETVDGMDVVAVEAAARRAVAAVRRTSEPYLLECRTYRFRAHSMFDAQLYRTKQEIEAWRQTRSDPCGCKHGWNRPGMMHSDEVANDRGRHRCRDRRGRRLRRSRHVGAGRGAGTLRHHGSGAAMSIATPHRMTYREAVQAGDPCCASSRTSASS